MFFEPNYWKCGRLAHQHVLDTWSRNEQMLAKQWKSPAVQQRIRGYVNRVYGASSVSNAKIFLPATNNAFFMTVYILHQGSEILTCSSR